MWLDFLEWLSELPQGGASFIGTVTGSSLGLVAVLFGALFNAHLNRRRDNALTEADRQALASALKAELSFIHQSAVKSATSIKTRPPVNDFLVLDLSHGIPLLPPMLPKIGLLDAATVGKVVHAYSILEEYAQFLVNIGGKLYEPESSQRRVIKLSREKAASVASLNDDVAAALRDAMGALDGYLVPKKLRLVPAWVGTWVKKPAKENIGKQGLAS